MNAILQKLNVVLVAGALVRTLAALAIIPNAVTVLHLHWDEEYQRAFSGLICGLAAIMYVGWEFARRPILAALKQFHDILAARHIPVPPPASTVAANVTKPNS